MSVKKSMKATGTVPTAQNVPRDMASGGRVLQNMVSGAKAKEGKSTAMSGARRGDSRRGGRMNLTRGEMSIVRREERTRMKNAGRTMRRGGRIMTRDGKRDLMMTTEGLVKFLLDLLINA
jgi:hypothetical protein